VGVRWDRAGTERSEVGIIKRRRCVTLFECLTISFLFYRFYKEMSLLYTIIGIIVLLIVFYRIIIEIQDNYENKKEDE
jgi:hypothetical protein